MHGGVARALWLIYKQLGWGLMGYIEYGPLEVDIGKWILRWRG